MSFFGGGPLEVFEDVSVAKKAPEVQVGFVAPDRDKQNKIVAVVEGKAGDFKNQVAISPEEREGFLKGLRTGNIPDSRIAGLVKDKIARPVDGYEGWADAWYELSGDKQMRMIAGTGGRLGIDRSNFDRGKFSVFLKKYPTPWEFWSAPGYIRGWLSPMNDKSKFEEYQKKALEMARMLYGDQQDVFDQMVFLREEAMEKREKKSESTKVENDVSFANPMAFEMDRIKGAYAVDVGVGNNYSKNEDFLVVDPEKEVFVVVDGVGGGGNGHEAGKIVAEKIADVVKRGDMSVEGLQKAQDEAGSKIVSDLGYENGAAVVVAWIEGNVLNTALTGDCRCVVLRKNPNFGYNRYDVAFTTYDQADLNILTNGVGGKRGGGEVEHQPFQLQPGDLVAGFSDGVGDALVDYKGFVGAVDNQAISLPEATRDMIDDGNWRLSNIAYQANGDPVEFVKMVGNVIGVRVRGAGGKGDNRSMFAFVFGG